ncbi:MAG TPA: DMT family transporter [Anaerolineales bacterium]|nr:DMT family transporter [Anaerolineales bacterium]
MAHPRQRFILPIALTTAILAVSTSSIFIRFAQEDAPSLVIAALRLTFATLLLAPIVWSRHREELMSLTRNELLLGLVSGLFLAVHFATWISSLEFTSVASSVVFVSTGPLWVALLSPVFLGERLERSALLGLGIAILGGALIGMSDACRWDRGLICPDLVQVMQGQTMWGNFLALAGAWTVSGYLIIGRKLRAKMSLLPYIFLVYGISATVLIFFMLASGESPSGYPVRTYGWIFLLAFFPQLIGHSTYNWVLRYIPATLVAIITLAEPLASAILAYMVLSEVPSRAVLLGGLLILAGIYLSSRQRRLSMSSIPPSGAA